MPDDRLFHKRLGHSEKVGRLTDFEYIVWHAYILSADDFGVMRFSALSLQADHDRIASRPQKTVQRALERVREVGLLVTFAHQGRLYCAQPDWQNHQRVKYPRQTINPKPPAELLATCSHATRQLFESHPGRSGRPVSEHLENVSETFPKDSPKICEAVRELARAPGREEANANANGLRLPANGTATALAREPSPSELPDDLAMRAGHFCTEVYPALYAKHRKGARYVSRPQMDFSEAVQLCRTWDDERLAKIATVFLTTDHEFAEKGSRTMAQFRSLASWCDGRLRERGL